MAKETEEIKQSIGLPKDLKIVNFKTDELIPYVKNTKAHPKKQVEKIAKSIETFGFYIPVLIDANNEIIAGHGRLLAAKHLGLEEVPCIQSETLTYQQAKAFRIADNKVAESDWLEDILAEELEELYSEGVDLIETGFSTEELEKELPHLFVSEEKKQEALDEDPTEYDDPIFPAQGEDDLSEEEMEMPLWDWVKTFSKILVMFSGGKDSMAMVAGLLNNGIPKNKILLVICEFLWIMMTMMSSLRILPKKPGLSWSCWERKCLLKRPAGCSGKGVCPIPSRQGGVPGALRSFRLDRG